MKKEKYFEIEWKDLNEILAEAKKNKFPYEEKKKNGNNRRS